MGGTCNGSTWRDTLSLVVNSSIELGLIDLFNPVVKEWTDDAYNKEMEYKKTADYQIYTITPKMTGVFSIAEAVYCAVKTPGKCIFCVLKDDAGEVFDDSQIKSLNRVAKMISDSGNKVCGSIADIADYLIEKALTD